MLECSGVVLYIVVVIVRIGEKVLVCGEDKDTRQVGSRKSVFFRIVDFVNLFGIVIKVFTYLVT